MKKSKNVLLFLFFSTIVILACQTLSPSQPALSGKDLYIKLRNDALQTKAEALGLKIDSNSNTPYGVIMDTVLDGGDVSTLISFASGDASLIADTGYGRTDGIKFQSVQIAAKKFVSVSAGFIDKMELTTDYSAPTIVGDIKFFVVTPQGVYTTKDLTEEEVMAGAIHKLWRAGADVITAFRLSDQQPTP